MYITAFGLLEVKMGGLIKITNMARPSKNCIKQEEDLDGIGIINSFMGLLIILRA